jgi:TolB protein
MRSYITCAVLVFLLFLAGCETTSLEDSITYDSATLQNVSRITDDGISKDWVEVSPDGGKILYCESERLLRWSDISNELVSSFKIILLRDAARAAKTPLVNDISYAPAWYEDNINFVYVVLENGNSKLVRSNISGGGKTYITRNAIGRWDARPNVRNHMILCDTDINGRRQVVSLRDNGTEVTVLGEGHSPSWHPGGTKFVFIRNDNIFEMDLNTNQATQVFSELDTWCRSPSYSKDGTYILFQKETSVPVIVSGSSFSFSSNKEVARWHLFTIKSDGTDLSQLTNGNVDVFSPSWGSDNTIYFVSNAGGNTEIWRARVNLD